MVKGTKHDLRRAMRQVLTDKQLRDSMVRKGLERSKKFSWEKAARETVKVYENVEKMALAGP